MTDVYKLPDGTAWPNPGYNHDPSVEWSLRYEQEVSGYQRCHAAWIVSAYSSLLSMSNKERNRVCAEIKKLRSAGASQK